VLPYLNQELLRALGLPLDLSFPLSPDNRLITLVQFNVKRALLSNMALLGLMGRPPTEQASCQNIPILPFPAPESIPESLRPTELQLTQRYHPILASMPFPKARDDMIRNASKYSIDEMAADVYGGLFEGSTTLDIRGVVVWGEPWMPEAWEFTEPFLRKWKFVIEDVSEMVSVSNRWREARGEERMIIEL
jgi:hypothetical protein